MNMKRLPFIVLFMSLSFFILPFGTLKAETIYVDNTVQGLINAINRANGLGGQNTIVLQPFCIYTLSTVDNETSDGDNGLPQINSSLSIKGYHAVIRRDPAAPEFRFFQVNSNSSLSLDHLTIENGRVANSDNSKHNGGGIYINDGEVSISSCVLADNYSGCGGAVLGVKGILTVTDSYFKNNTGFL
jgi:hypothetical protein